MSIHDDLDALIEMLRRLRRDGDFTETGPPSGTIASNQSPHVKLVPRFKRSVLTQIAPIIEPVLLQPFGELKVECDRIWDYLRNCPHPDKAVFTIKPNTSDQALARFSWLQMLFVIAQLFGSQNQRIIPTGLHSSLNKKGRVQSAAEESWRDYEGAYLGPGMVDHLVEAFEHLRDLLPKNLVLDGDYLVHQGKRLDRKLSPTEQRFMELLIDAAGSSVSGTLLQSAKINHPDKVKDRLVKKSDFNFLDQLIKSDYAGGYYLSTS